MNLDKLFGSRTKTDILKFLVFRRQGVSVRAFEAELSWSFPAIKKQVDQLEEAGVIKVDKENNRWCIFLVEGIDEYIKAIFLFTLEQELLEYFRQEGTVVERYYLGNMFGYIYDMDLVIVHDVGEREATDKIKFDINHIFSRYHTDTVKLVFMSTDEYEKRNRLADKFVLQVMTNMKEQIVNKE